MISLLARFFLWMERLDRMWVEQTTDWLYFDDPALPTAAARGNGAGGPADPRPTL